MCQILGYNSMSLLATRFSNFSTWKCYNKKASYEWSTIYLIYIYTCIYKFILCTIQQFTVKVAKKFWVINKGGVVGIGPKELFFLTNQMCHLLLIVVL